MNERRGRSSSAAIGDEKAELPAPSKWSKNWTVDDDWAFLVSGGGVQAMNLETPEA